MAVVLTGVFGEEEDFTTEPGKWSIREIAAHLADSELVAGHRFRQVAAEDNPTLVAYDQSAWAHRLGYAARKPKNSLESFRRYRAENHELLRSLEESDFERIGNHTGNGRVTLLELVETYARHAESHAAQIEAIREQYRKAKAARG